MKAGAVLRWVVRGAGRLRRWGCRGLALGWALVRSRWDWVRWHCPWSQQEWRDRAPAILILLAWFAIALANFVIPGSYVFEGSLIVRGMNFTYAGGADKSFLTAIEGIQGFDLQGKQTKPLLLTGRFSSDDAALDRQLRSRRQLRLELPYATSRLIVAPVNPDDSQLSLLELSLRPGSRVNQLTYRTSSHPDATRPDAIRLDTSQQLSFCLQSERKSAESCLFPDDLTHAAPGKDDAPAVGTLELQLGEQPLWVTTSLVALPELGIQADPDDREERTFQFTPTIGEPPLDALLSPTAIAIALPQKTDTAEPDRPNQWFWGDLEVKDTRFIEFQMGDRTTDEIQISTILAGEVRMGSEKMQLQKHQFLIVSSEKPGIQQLRYIQIHPQDPAGLQTFISGKSAGIATGLYPDFPVQSIQPGWLSKYLSPEAVSALLAFLATCTAIFLPRLFVSSNSKTTSAHRGRGRRGRSG